ncbi:MAG: esterase-like activity of phytase family protein [Solirubrobacterales bacterium]|nr:esterase-like activity of phytase family protein [Solirubrobacterales bacterium]
MIAGASTLALAGAASVGAQPRSSTSPKAHAADHTYSAKGALSVPAKQGLLSKGSGGPLALTANTQPQHGSLTVAPDGSFKYTPKSGYKGKDSFSYSVSNAVHLYTDHVPSLGKFGGVSLNGGGFGSSVYPDPGHPGYVYGLEDRGPNVSSSNSAISSSLAVEPIPNFDPSIGLFKLTGNDAKLVKRIPLADAKGHPYSGRVNSQNPTGEQIEDVAGKVQKQDPNGYDSEGLVALPDGTFWVSDEYGPFITHFNAAGHQIGRLSPFSSGKDGLPPELRYRTANQGLEGLTITPDGKELVAAVQSALNQPDLGSTKAKKLAATRIVTYDLKTGAEHEYIYLLHNPAQNSGAISELTALSDHTFLVDERDGNFPGKGAFKRLYKIDIAGATDVGPKQSVKDPGHKVSYAGDVKASAKTPLGLLIDGKSIESLVRADSKKSATQSADTEALLKKNGITPVSSSLDLDLNALLGSLNSKYAFYSHDKIEGVAAIDGGKQLVISNDSDFGLADFEGTGAEKNNPPWTLKEKTSPVTGKEDNGEYLAIDTSRVSATKGAKSSALSTAKVTINVK